MAARGCGCCHALVLINPALLAIGSLFGVPKNRIVQRDAVERHQTHGDPGQVLTWGTGGFGRWRVQSIEMRCAFYGEQQVIKAGKVCHLFQHARHNHSPPSFHRPALLCLLDLRFTFQTELRAEIQAQKIVVNFCCLGENMGQ
jgi:hypothetical protein